MRSGWRPVCWREMIGTITNPRIAEAIGSACGAAARDVRDRMETATRREAQGQAATREDTFTDDLADAMDAIGEGLEEHLLALSGELARRGSDVQIEFATEKAPQGEETAFGLDLGIRLIIETPGYKTEKAILVQCKRMYGTSTTGSFPKLTDDGEDQAENMLKVTPA